MTRTRILWRGTAVAAAVLAALGLRWSTMHPWSTGTADVARVRQSWSARPERIERCRRLTDEELAQLPQHMRLRTQCEGEAAQYLLVVSVDNARVVTDTLRGGGLRHDRPIHVFSEFDVQPGVRRLRVEVTRLAGAAGQEDRDRDERQETDTLLGGRAQRESDERARRMANALPATLVLDTLLALAPRRVALVTYAAETRRLAAQMQR